MPRKTKLVTIAGAPGPDNRDGGKRFLLTEMPAIKSERWATRFLMGMAKTGVQIPADIVNTGMAGAAYFGFQLVGSLPPEIAEPLLDEMLTCIQVQEDLAVRPLFPDSDFEEVITILTLRREVFELHTDFLRAAAPSILAIALAAQSAFKNTSTSLAGLDGSSALASPPTVN